MISRNRSSVHTTATKNNSNFCILVRGVVYNVTVTMRPKKNAQTKPSTTSVLQPKCYRIYNEVSSLSAVKLKQLCGQYNIDPTLPKKAKIQRNIVHSIKYCENEESSSFAILSARCNASQSSNADEVKVLFVVIDKITGEPYSGYCTCTAGFSGTCGHVGATLFLVAEQMANGVAKFTSNDKRSCTDKLCGWAQPEGSHVEPDIFENFNIKKRK
ncbi:hypothetical protein MAR_017360 [Mya arenaria]|uniref:SWIM-type domain-containing protein n=1 Tax=Mya arenaria TaxID=6604 RepID=A0ABY7EBI8_MYAAR|nr:hypothetical protein MAR_017360 [Mya arenaria]